MAVLIQNQLNQRLIINLIKGKNIDILAKGAATISKDELSSEHLQILIAKGDIVIRTDPAEKDQGRIAEKRGKGKEIRGKTKVKKPK